MTVSGKHAGRPRDARRGDMKLGASKFVQQRLLKKLQGEVIEYSHVKDGKELKGRASWGWDGIRQ